MVSRLVGVSFGRDGGGGDGREEAVEDGDLVHGGLEACHVEEDGGGAEGLWGRRRLRGRAGVVLRAAAEGDVVECEAGGHGR